MHRKPYLPESSRIKKKVFRDVVYSEIVIKFNIMSKFCSKCKKYLFMLSIFNDMIFNIFTFFKALGSNYNGFIAKQRKIRLIFGFPLKPFGITMISKVQI